MNRRAFLFAAIPALAASPVAPAVDPRTLTAANWPFPYPYPIFDVISRPATESEIAAMEWLEPLAPAGLPWTEIIARRRAELIDFHLESATAD